MRTWEGMEYLRKDLGQLAKRRQSKLETWAAGGREGKLGSLEGAPRQLSINTSAAEMPLPTELGCGHLSR